MGGVEVGKFSATSPDYGDRVWPLWARWVVTGILAFHLMAVMTGALAASPSSLLERWLADGFAEYHHAVDQGYAYRYYAPEPGPTPVVTATIRFHDSRPAETLRLPTRGAWPRLRYQRQMALANHLVADFEAARRETGDGKRSAYARSYARHLVRTRSGCSTVTLYAQAHLIPDPLQVREALAKGTRVDLEAEEYYTTPERIGEFLCDEF
ncbi:MAG: hypothetical protein NVSMB9_26180 [Isosphaeraceae bacterium]